MATGMLRKSSSGTNTVSDDSEQLVVPSMRFNRSMGTYANQPYDMFGDRLKEEDWEDNVNSELPTDADRVPFFLAALSRFGYSDTP
jgi:hypothetical protein